MPLSAEGNFFRFYVERQTKLELFFSGAIITANNYGTIPAVLKPMTDMQFDPVLLKTSAHNNNSVK